jgi:glucose-6-phosphate isomerase
MIEFEKYFEVDLDNDADKKMMNAFGSLVYEKERGISGYYNLPYDSINLLTEVENFMVNEDGVYESAENIVVIGIGGSSLGTKAIHSMLRHKYKNIKNMLFFENPDPVIISNGLYGIKKENSIFVIVSKSGGTVETISIFKTVISFFDIDLTTVDKKRVIVISDEGSPLCRFADSYALKAFTIPGNVGGRFSVLSAVGVVPLALTGYNVKDILEGAKKFMESFFDTKEEHIALKAFFQVENYKRYPVNVLFSYADFMEDFTKWFVQLWAESLGKIDKNGNHVGLTPVGHIGSVDQHSFLQLIMQGPKDKTVTFIKIKDFENDLLIPDISLDSLEKTDFVNAHSFNDLINAECDATKESIIAENIPVDLITLDKLSETNIGALIMYFELLTSYAGALFGINTYDQPGVEFGKKILVKKFEGNNE